MKKTILLFAIASLAATGCQSTNGYDTNTSNEKPAVSPDVPAPSDNMPPAIATPPNNNPSGRGP
jgi:hypothetical protein